MSILDKLYLELSDHSEKITLREAISIDEATKIIETATNDKFTEEERLDQIIDRAKIIIKKLKREGAIEPSAEEFERPIDYEQNYNNIVEIEKCHRRTIGEQNTVIERQNSLNVALSLENKMLWKAIKEDHERSGSQEE